MSRDQLFKAPPFENHSPLTWYQAASQSPNFIHDQAQAHAIEYLDFHAFMAEIHQRLKVLKSEANPLKSVAAEIAKETRVLCFDEFHVSDIADAMILGRLLENLLNEGVVLVATSNYAPSELYPQGQNRSSFLPTIALIESSLTVLNVDGGEDYRLRTLRPAEIFFTPANEENEAKLAKLFKEMAGITDLNPGISTIHGREIPHKAESGRAIWFDFRALCFGPRSQSDYLYLAEHYEMVFLSGLEKLSPQEKAEARRLTWLIDVLYDFRVKLCATSAVDVNHIYTEGDFAEEFTRTASRMVEMQSEVYLEQPHLTLSPKD